MEEGPENTEHIVESQTRPRLGDWAQSLRAKAGRARSAVSPWVQGLLARTAVPKESRGAIRATPGLQFRLARQAAFSQEHTQDLLRRISRKPKVARVWRPEAGAVTPRATARFANQIVQRLPAIAQKYRLEVAEDVGEEGDLALAPVGVLTRGAPPESTGRPVQSPESWPARPPAQPDSSPRPTMQMRAVARAPRPVQRKPGVRPVSSVEEITPGAVAMPREKETAPAPETVSPAKPPDAGLIQAEPEASAEVPDRAVPSPTEVERPSAHAPIRPDLPVEPVDRTGARPEVRTEPSSEQPEAEPLPRIEVTPPGAGRPSDSVSRAPLPAPDGLAERGQAAMPAARSPELPPEPVRRRAEGPPSVAAARPTPLRPEGAAAREVERPSPEAVPIDTHPRRPETRPSLPPRGDEQRPPVPEVQREAEVALPPAIEAAPEAEALASLRVEAAPEPEASLSRAPEAVPEAEAVPSLRVEAAPEPDAALSLAPEAVSEAKAAPSLRVEAAPEPEAVLSRAPEAVSEAKAVPSLRVAVAPEPEAALSRAPEAVPEAKAVPSLGVEAAREPEAALSRAPEAVPEAEAVPSPRVEPAREPEPAMPLAQELVRAFAEPAEPVPVRREADEAVVKEPGMPERVEMPAPLDVREPAAAAAPGRIPTRPPDAAVQARAEPVERAPEVEAPPVRRDVDRGMPPQAAGEVLAAPDMAPPESVAVPRGDVEARPPTVAPLGEETLTPRRAVAERGPPPVEAGTVSRMPPAIRPAAPRTGEPPTVTVQRELAAPPRPPVRQTIPPTSTPKERRRAVLAEPEPTEPDRPEPMPEAGVPAAPGPEQVTDGLPGPEPVPTPSPSLEAGQLGIPPVRRAVTEPQRREETRPGAITVETPAARPAVRRAATIPAEPAVRAAPHKPLQAETAAPQPAEPEDRAPVARRIQPAADEALPPEAIPPVAAVVPEEEAVAGLPQEPEPVRVRPVTAGPPAEASRAEARFPVPPPAGPAPPAVSRVQRSAQEEAPSEPEEAAREPTGEVPVRVPEPGVRPRVSEAAARPAEGEVLRPDVPPPAPVTEVQRAPGMEMPTPRPGAELVSRAPSRSHVPVSEPMRPVSRGPSMEVSRTWEDGTRERTEGAEPRREAPTLLSRAEPIGLQRRLAAGRVETTREDTVPDLERPPSPETGARPASRSVQDRLERPVRAEPGPEPSQAWRPASTRILPALGVTPGPGPTAIQREPMPLPPLVAPVPAEALQRRAETEPRSPVTVQLAIEPAPEAPAEPEEAEGPEAPAMDLEALARRVYPVIKRMLAVERERLWSR